MSGTRVFANEGQAATWVDVQRAFDVAASSEDRVWSLVFRPQWAGSGIYDKRVHPLTPEPQFGSYVRPRLVYGGTIVGGVDVLPADYIIGAAGDPSANANASLLSATGYFDTNTQLPSLYSLPATAFPSSSGSDGRVDLVYAIVESVATQDERKVKHPQTGQVLTETVTIFTSPTVSFGVVTGAQDGTFTVGDVPTDTGTKWHFPLAFILLDDGALGPWTQGTAIAQTRISQFWNSGWISRNRVQLAEAASVMSDAYSAGVNGRATTPLSNRWGASITACAVMQHKVDGTGGYIVVDGNHDWRGRIITIKCGRVADNANAAAMPDDTTKITRFGAASGDATAQIFAFTPQSVPAATHQAIAGATWNPNSETISFFVNDTGQLEAEFQGTPTTAYYLFLVEASDQFRL